MKKPRPSRELLHAFLLAGTLLLKGQSPAAADEALVLGEHGSFEAPGLSVLVFNNSYDGLFSDAKISGIELIHHDVRSVTNGDVRLSCTPAQWDPVPQLLTRRVLPEQNAIEADLEYKDLGLRFTLRAESKPDGLYISVNLPQPLPENLVGKAGFNLEFLPSAYFHRNLLVDGHSASLPLHPSSDMRLTPEGHSEPLPLAEGRQITFAPEDPTRRVTVTARGSSMSLYDGRNTATNGWFVLRSLLPGKLYGRVLEWRLDASRVPGWLRPLVIGHSQLGYVPGAPKVAVIEMDRRQPVQGCARVLRLDGRGQAQEVYSAEPVACAPYLRYQYLRFDFSAVSEPGLYQLEYAGVRTRSFRIAPDVYDRAWHASLDVYLPVQMDHMYVKEAYRVWHGRSHRDDARQAPVNHEHFDLYAQGPTTDTPYKPGEHIPGLNVGGWYDAGDFDIRTQTQYALIQSLVYTWEDFRPERDQTTIDQAASRVILHKPDGTPDLIEQIEHGALALVAQHRAVGHAIHGIIEPTLDQYTHLGDGSTKTDNLIYDPALKPGEEQPPRSGTPDDRWAFTTRSSALNYGSAAGLAAASRALRGYREDLAKECLATALHVWDEEQGHAPDLFHHGNTTGGELKDEQFKAALELLHCTKEPRFAEAIRGLLPAVGEEFLRNGVEILRALPLMDQAYRDQVAALALRYKKDSAENPLSRNPYRVPITTGGWAGSGFVIHHGILHYLLHQAFPAEFGADPVYEAASFLYGCHPGHDLSLVSGVGTASKEVAYGNNRADFSFIAGGVVPGILILKPDFPENKEDWPFLWGENEYVVNLGGSHIYLANALSRLARDPQ
jgi:hypothetical protein